MTRLHGRFRAVVVGIAATLALSCEKREPDLSTGPYATTGVTLVSGRVVSTSGTPLDSVRILGGVPDGAYAEYSQGVYVLSATDGTYILRIERGAFHPTLAPDTVLLRVRVDPLKYADRLPGTTPPSVLRELRITFGEPSNPSVTVVPDIVLTVAR